MEKYLSLKASAGSGKTFALTVRYISLLFLGAKANEILTLTFTNKASNEMSERILNTLLKFGEDEDYLNEIIKVTNLDKNTLLEKKQKVLNNFLNSNLSIMTIDKFVNKILREFSGYLGISDDFEIGYDDIEELSYKYLKSVDEVTFSKLLDISSYEEKKFNTLISLFKFLIEKNEEINAINLEKDLITLQKEKIISVALEFKNELLKCEKLSNRAQNALDFDNIETFWNKSKSWLIKPSVSEHSDFKKGANETNEAIFRELQSEVKNYFKLRANYALNLLNELFKNFKEFKYKYNKKINRLEFSDISNLSFLLLSKFVDKEFLYFRLDTKYEHILIDEFQDTSILQYKILEPLIQEVTSGMGSGFKTFFYVGDTKQSIYRFRGGNKELFDYVSKTFKNINTQILTTNYRSTEVVVNFVNDLFLNLKSYDYDKQFSKKEGGYVEVIDDATLSDRDFETLKNKLKELLELGNKESSIAILTYTNDDVKDIYEYLSEHLKDVSITTEMTQKLINQDNVSCVINLIKYLYFKEQIYKANFNVKLNRPELQDIDFDINLLNNSIQTIIKDIAFFYNIMDENIIKFIETSIKYKNIVEFIYSIDKNEETLANKKNNGIEILTIFKSKGLEWDSVFIIDRLKRKNADRGSLLFEYEGIELKQIFYKMSNYEYFDKEYANAKEKEVELAIEDELNILYVALTRAKNNLYIIKKEKSSVFELLNIHSGIIGEKIISKEDKSNNVKQQIVEYKPLSLGKQEDKLKVEEENENSSIEAREFGLAVHYMLEMMPKFSSEFLEYSYNIMKNKYINYMSEEILHTVKDRVEKLINDEFFYNITKDATLYKEQSFLYKDELKIIDLLIEKNGEYFIFDYKTTLIEDSKHIIQVNNYINAMKDILKNDKIKGYLVYLNNQGVKFKEVSNRF